MKNLYLKEKTEILILKIQIVYYRTKNFIYELFHKNQRLFSCMPLSRYGSGKGVGSITAEMLLSAHGLKNNNQNKGN